MKRTALYIITIISLLTAAACNKAKVSGGIATGMTAKINDAGWAADSYTAQLDSAQAPSILLSINGSQGSDSTGTLIALHVDNFKNQTGEFPISATTNMAEYVDLKTNSFYVATGGTISINKITATSVAGTFSFSVGGITVTTGQFNVPMD